MDTCMVCHQQKTTPYFLVFMVEMGRLTHFQVAYATHFQVAYARNVPVRLGEHL